MRARGEGEGAPFVPYPPAGSIYIRVCFIPDCLETGSTYADSPAPHASPLPRREHTPCTIQNIMCWTIKSYEYLSSRKITPERN